MTSRPIEGFTPPVSSSGTSSDGLSDDLCAQLGKLQELVCELLFKNQQLRMALTEANMRARKNP
jgi:hypothetical protein